MFNETRKLTFKRVGASHIPMTFNTKMDIHTWLREYYNTKDIQFSSGSIHFGKSNMPAVYIVTTDNEQFKIHVYKD
jgi:hypothetical protein